MCVMPTACGCATWEYIADKPDYRPAIVCDDVEDVILGGLELSARRGNAPLIELNNTRRAFVTGMRVPQECQVFTQVSGSMSSDIRLLGNSMQKEQRAVNCVNGAVENVVKLD